MLLPYPVLSARVVAWSFDLVVFAWHGETEWDVFGHRQGQLDSALTPAGIITPKGSRPL